MDKKYLLAPALAAALAASMAGCAPSDEKTEPAPTVTVTAPAADVADELEVDPVEEPVVDPASGPADDPVDEPTGQPEEPSYNITGLWVTLNLPYETEDVLEEYPDGSAYLTTTIGGWMSHTIERMEPLAMGDDAMISAVVAMQGLQSADELGQVRVDPIDVPGMSYPVYQVSYETGSGSDTFQNVDAFVYTDSWTFRVHFEGHEAEMSEMYTDVESWLQTMELVDL